jgi:L-lactate dehydrogenase complex protein LldG
MAGSARQLFVSSARNAILARLRHAYGRDAEAEVDASERVEARLRAGAPNLIPERGQLEPAARVQLFTEMMTAVMGETQEVATLADVPAVVAAYLRQHNLPQRIALAPEPFLDRCGWERQPLLRIRRGTAEPGDVTGVTLALAGIAETGTVVLASAPERPALLAFLPETSIIILPKERIEGAPEQAWAWVEGLPEGLPRSINMITGPSRTADIASKLELGAHGPKRLLVLLVDQIGE